MATSAVKFPSLLLRRNMVESYQNETLVAKEGEREVVAHSRIYILAITILLAIIATAALYDFRDTDLTSFTYLKSSDHKKSESSVVISITASSPDYQSLDSLSYLPWDNLIEPYRDQYLAISAVIVDGVDDTSTYKHSSADKYNFEWTILGETYSGYVVTVNVQATGIFNCTVSIEDNSDGTVYSSNFTLAVKYVRREIRSLTESDRDAFFDALQLLYTTNSTDGIALYGAKFANAEKFLYHHLNGAARSDCDHWHDGAGFITQHTAFTLFAEQSLQSVNPSIAMPYWEYAQVAVRSFK